MTAQIYLDDRDDSVYVIWGNRGAYLQADSDGNITECMHLPPTAIELNPPEDLWSEGFESGKDEGYDQGWQDGHDAGYREGYVDGNGDNGEEDW